MKRIATFTLGQYARTRRQADLDDFAAAFQNYSVAVYRSYLGLYAGQALKVTGSSAARAGRLHRLHRDGRSRAIAAGSSRCR